MSDFADALAKARADRIPVMALRPDHQFPDELDDVVVEHVETLHFEAMSDDQWWMAATFANGEQAVFWFTIASKPKRIAVTCTDQPSEWRDWDELRHNSGVGEPS
jgi:hypothetical protein